MNKKTLALLLGVSVAQLATASKSKRHAAAEFSLSGGLLDSVNGDDDVLAAGDDQEDCLPAGPQAFCDNKDIDICEEIVEEFCDDHSLSGSECQEEVEDFCSDLSDDECQHALEEAICEDDLEDALGNAADHVDFCDQAHLSDEECEEKVEEICDGMSEDECAEALEDYLEECEDALEGEPSEDECEDIDEQCEEECEDASDEEECEEQCEDELGDECEDLEESHDSDCSDDEACEEDVRSEVCKDLTAAHCEDLIDEICDIIGEEECDDIINEQCEFEGVEEDEFTECKTVRVKIYDEDGDYVDTVVETYCPDDGVGSGDDDCPSDDDDDNLQGDAAMDAFDTLAQQWEQFIERMEELQERIEDMEEQLEDCETELPDNLQGDIDDQADQICELQERIETLEEDHVQQVLDHISEDGLRIGDRWVIKELSSGDLMIDDTETTGSRYKFEKDDSQTFPSDD